MRSHHLENQKHLQDEINRAIANNRHQNPSAIEANRGWPKTSVPTIHPDHVVPLRMINLAQRILLSHIKHQGYTLQARKLAKKLETLIVAHGLFPTEDYDHPSDYTTEEQMENLFSNCDRFCPRS